MVLTLFKCLYFTHIKQDTHTILSSTQSATALMPLSPVAIGGFRNISTEVLYPASIERPTAAPDDINFDAPINSLISFSEPWMGWVPPQNRAGDIGSGIS
jgi:hypothetical protein